MQTDEELAAHWKTQVEQVDQEYHNWYERCKRISNRYRDERKTTELAGKNLNLFWSNTQTLKQAIYAKPPVPNVERRFLDKDTTGRVAATILERSLRYETAMSGLDSALRRVRLDYLLVGRGQSWVRYNPKFETAISPVSTANDEIIADGSGKDLEKDREEEETKETERFVSESLDVCYVHWQDYYQFPAGVRTEEEIQGKGRRLYMSRQDLHEKFDDEIGAEAVKRIELDYVPQALPQAGEKALVANKSNAQATVYEIWWKPTRRVYFIAKGYEKVLMEVDDPLHLEGFFPCPPALQATTTNDTMIPVPDYAEAQDQYTQIDLLTKRIDILTGALKVVGVYDAAAQSLKRVFEEASEPNLIPVDSWAMFAEKGGLKGAIDFVPLKDIADTLKAIIEVRTQLMADLDHVTGISDIQRGTSDARETMGGVRLKQNASSGRLQDRQDDVARYCRDLIGIMGELIAEHYDEKTLIQVSGALFDEGMEPPPPEPPQSPMMGHNGGPPLNALPPQGMMGAPPQAAIPPAGGVMGVPPPALSPEQIEQQKLEARLLLIQKAIDLLRSDKIRGFRIDIETDSTVQGDAQEEKAARIEFIEGVTKFIETAGQVTMITPEFAPLAAKMLQFGVRGFRVGRDLEASIEEFCDTIEKKMKQMAGQPKPPSPEEIKANTEKMKAEADMASNKQKAEMDAASHAAEVQRQQLENQNEAQNRAAEIRMKEMDGKLKEMDVEIAKIKAAADIHKTKMDFDKTGRDNEHNEKKMDHESKKMAREDAAADADLNKKAMDLQDHHKKIVNAEIEPMKMTMGEMMKHIAALHEHNAAPIEMMHGPDGKLSAVKRGNNVVPIKRNRAH